MASQARDDARSRLRPFGIVFERSLHDLIRGIRAAKDPAAREVYIRNALADCRAEAKNPDMETKTMAVIKLTYLEMYGHDMSWASFHVLEVMSSAKFQQKRVGYLAAIQSFRADTDVLMLTTNLLKKDLGSANHLEVSISLGAAASIITSSLAQDIADDIVKMLNSSRPYIRKKAVLAMFKVFLQYPEALRTAFPRLKDKLQDPDPSVVSATVNVICELSKQSPAASKSCLALAPQLYELLTTSKNNWMLIKILKLFSYLAPTEPRLKPKLMPQIIQLMQNTTAMSLLYECVNCIVSGEMLDENDVEIAALCVSKLRMFLEESDQNLKYVGILALSKVVNKYPQFVSSHQDVILECVDNDDLTIRERVLDLVYGIVNEDNLYYIVNRLLVQLRESDEASVSLTSQYRIQVISRIIDLCAKDTYANLPDFEWYIEVLQELVQLARGSDEVGAAIGDQLRNVAVRVKGVRQSAVEAAVGLLSNYALMRKMPSIVPLLVWIAGEFAQMVVSPTEVLSRIIKTDFGSGEGGARTEEICIQAVVKLYAVHVGTSNNIWTPTIKAEVQDLTRDVVAYLELHSTDMHYEVQERSVGFLELFKVAIDALEQHPENTSEPPLLLSLAIPSLFNGYELNPVAPTSQANVEKPEELDLESRILPEYALSDSEDDDFELELLPEVNATNHVETYDENEPDEDELERRRVQRLERQRDDPFYIPISSGRGTPVSGSVSGSVSHTPISESPIQLMDGGSGSLPRFGSFQRAPRKAKVEIIQDEFIGDSKLTEASRDIVFKKTAIPSKKPLLKIQSRLGELDLDGVGSGDAGDEDAMREVEKLREDLLIRSAIKPDETVTVTHKKVKSKKSTLDGVKSDGTKKKKTKKAAEVNEDGTVKEVVKKKKKSTADGTKKVKKTKAVEMPVDGPTES